jgi:hypothetical protein
MGEWDEWPMHITARQIQNERCGFGEITSFISQPTVGSRQLLVVAELIF